MTENDARVVAVFARAPEFGRVKTRLARTIGDAAALAAHEELVTATLARLAGADFALELWIAGDVAHPQVLKWSGEFGLPVREQQGADLGRRMAGAFDGRARRGGRMVVVGCDCPTIDGAYVSAAMAALANHDLVLGPAEDGGYGLIGLRRQSAAVFRNVPWGTNRVLDTTLAIARKTGLSVKQLELIWDVDTAADWNRYLDEFSPDRRPG